MLVLLLLKKISAMTPYISLFSGREKCGWSLLGAAVSPQAVSQMVMVRRKVTCSSTVAPSRCGQTPLPGTKQSVLPWL